MLAAKIPDPADPARAIAPGVLFVRGDDHLDLFREVLEKAEKTLILEVPWILGKAGRDFADYVPHLLRRGVEVSIYYGYSDADQKNEPALVELFQRLLGQRFRRVARGTHEKVLLVDGALCIVGSWNWLSNGHARQRRELSVILRGEAARAIAREPAEACGWAREIS